MAILSCGPDAWRLALSNLDRPGDLARSARRSGVRGPRRLDRRPPRGLWPGGGMKILSDFDGVMTDQTEEGHTELRLFREELLRLAGSQAAHVQRVLDLAVAELIRDPFRHG